MLSALSHNTLPEETPPGAGDGETEEDGLKDGDGEIDKDGDLETEIEGEGEILALPKTPVL